MTRTAGRPRHFCVEVLESRQVLSAMLGLTTSNALASFDSSRPDLIQSITPIVGLQASESILAIDSRAATGQIYGLGSTGRIYTLDPTSGVGSLVGNGPIATPLSGSDFNIDFNGGSSALRITSDRGQDLLVDVDSGLLTVDPNLFYSPTDVGAGTVPHIVGAAYNNNRPDSVGGVLFEIDTARNALVTQQVSVNASGVEQSTGVLTTFSPLALDVSGASGLEVTPEGVMLLSLTPTGSTRSSLYAFSATGSLLPLNLVGAFPSSITIRDITSLPAPKTVYAVTSTNTLISFASVTPGTLLSSHPILGTQPGESILAIAFRPSTGALYGFGSTGRLYTIDLSTGNATSVSSSPISPAYDGSKPSIDFISGVDRLKLVTKLGQNLRINADLGVVDEVDNPLTYGPTDPSSGFVPSIVTESQASTASGTSLFGIDSARDTLVTQDTSPLSGTLTTIGPLGLDITQDAGLDTAPFSSGTTITLASLTETGATGSILYRINPRTTSSSTPVPVIAIGTIAGGAIVRDLAIAPTGLVGFSTPSFTVSEDAGVATITVVRTAGSAGPIQVRYVSFNGSAQAGVNYTPVNGILNFGDGETSKSFTIPIRTGSFSSGSRTVNLSLSVDSGILTSQPTAVLTIQAPSPTLTPGISSTNFLGGATSINSVEVVFKGAVDPTLASNPAYFVVKGITSDRSARTVSLEISSAIYDAATSTTYLTFASPFALSVFRSLQVTGKGFNTGATDAVVNYGVQRGVSVRYLDADGDRVILAVIGRKAKLVVLRRVDGGTASAWVEGKGRIVTGFLLPRRGSNHATRIDRFVTNGAKLKLARSITVRQIVITG